MVPLTQVPRGPAFLLRVLITFSFPARYLDPKKWRVQLGQLTSKPSLWNSKAYSGRYRVKDIIVNSEDTTRFHDLALLRLASSVTYNKYIQPICVLPSTFVFQQQPDCWVTGWGVLQEKQSETRDRRGGDVGGLTLVPVLAITGSKVLLWPLELCKSPACSPAHPPTCPPAFSLPPTCPPIILILPSLPFSLFRPVRSFLLF